MINRKPKIQNHRGKMRTEANLELAKEVKTNSRGFQPSKLDDSKEKNSEAGLREDGFKVGTDTFQK